MGEDARGEAVLRCTCRRACTRWFCFLRATLEVDGGGIAIASCVVSDNERLPRPPFVPEGVFTIAFCVGFFWPFFFACTFGAGSSSSLEGVSKSVLELLDVSSSISAFALYFPSAFLRFSSFCFFNIALIVARCFPDGFCGDRGLDAR